MGFGSKDEYELAVYQLSFVNSYVDQKIGFI